jgi:multiple sugar transport system permease protein
MMTLRLPRRVRPWRIALYFGVLVILVETLAPFLWLIISSISTQAELLSSPPHWIPWAPTLERYTNILFSGQVDFRGRMVNSPAAAFRQAMLNSLIIAGSTTVVCLICGVLTSYSAARLRLPGKTKFMMLIIAVQMLPPIALVIPLYFIIRSLGLMDTYTALIMVYSTFTLTYIVWVMTGYLQTLPREIEEAALIDGCGRIGVLIRVVLPLSRPGLVAVGILSFLTAWNEFLFALIFTSTLAAKPIPVAVAEFSTEYGIDYGMMTTGGVLASIPPVLLAVFFQRYLMQGLTAGAVKG